MDRLEARDSSMVREKCLPILEQIPSSASVFREGAVRV